MNEESTPRRVLAAGFAVCALATGTLLASHPSGGGGSFAEVLKAEAANQLGDAFVHGGFIVTLSVLIACFAVWSRMLTRARHQVRVVLTVGMVMFCVGCGAMMASMVVDGFAVPAIAARFAATGVADSLASARTLMVFCGTLIRVLMPLGLAFQAVAVLCWSCALLKIGGGAGRAVGGFGAACAIASLVLFLAFTNLSGRWLPAVILTQGVWYFGLAASLLWPGKVLSQKV